MEITKDTYIDTLQRLKMVSSSTRNKCVDRAIFAIKDLEQFLDYRGKIVLRGFTDRSIIELQNAWDKACGSSAASSSTNKPRRLTRILSQEEKSTISELEDLFESTYMGGCNVVKDDSSINSENVVAEKETIESTDAYTEKLQYYNQLKVFSDNMSKFSDFITKFDRLPSIQAKGEELEIARWLEYIFSHKSQFGKTEQEIIQTLTNVVKFFE